MRYFLSVLAHPSDVETQGGRIVQMTRTPTEFAVHLMVEGGHREEVRFASIQDFQKWYGNELVPKAASEDFITVPIKNIQGEYMVVRPSRIMAIRVEPIFSSSVERY
jgi:hypothetical protein